MKHRKGWDYKLFKARLPQYLNTLKTVYFMLLLVFGHLGIIWAAKWWEKHH